MSSYLQRLFNRAATPPAPALAATGQVAPASRLTSPIAEADQRFNLPGFEAIAFDANAPAALESTGQPFAQTPQFLREPPQAANDSTAKFTPPLRAVPDTNGDSSVYGASEVELAPGNIELLAPAETAAVGLRSDIVVPEPAPRNLEQMDRAPFRQAPETSNFPAPPVRRTAGEAALEVPAIGDIVRLDDVRAPSPPGIVKSSPHPPVAEEEETHRPAPAEWDLPPRPHAIAAVLNAPQDDPEPLAVPELQRMWPEPERASTTAITINEIIVEIKSPKAEAKPQPELKPQQRPLTAEAASIIGPLPVPRRSVAIFGMRRR